MEGKPEYVSGKIATEKIGVHSSTLRRYDAQGLIDTIRTPGGKRMYNVKKFLNQREKNIPIHKEKICYCRVSTHGQKNDLKSQVNQQIPPLSPRVNIAAAKQADNVLNFNLKNY